MTTLLLVAAGLVLYSAIAGLTAGLIHAAEPFAAGGWVCGLLWPAFWAVALVALLAIAVSWPCRACYRRAAGAPPKE